MGLDSYEKAHRKLIEEAIQTAMQKENIQKEDIQFLIAGDLINQITPTSFAARTANPIFRHIWCLLDLNGGIGLCLLYHQLSRGKE